MKKAILSIAVIVLTAGAVVMANPSTIFKPKSKCTNAHCADCKECKDKKCADCKCDDKCTSGACTSCSHPKTCAMPKAATGNAGHNCCGK